MRGRSSRARCFGTGLTVGSPGLKGECESCSSNTECSTNKCWGFSLFDRKCVFDNNLLSRNKCFGGIGFGKFDKFGKFGKFGKFDKLGKLKTLLGGILQ